MKKTWEQTANLKKFGTAILVAAMVMVGSTANAGTDPNDGQWEPSELQHLAEELYQHVLKMLEAKQTAPFADDMVAADELAETLKKYIGTRDMVKLFESLSLVGQGSNQGSLAGKAFGLRASSLLGTGLPAQVQAGDALSTLVGVLITLVAESGPKALTKLLGVALRAVKETVILAFNIVKGSIDLVAGMSKATWEARKTKWLSTLEIHMQSRGYLMSLKKLDELVYKSFDGTVNHKWRAPWREAGTGRGRVLTDSQRARVDLVQTGGMGL